MISSTSSVESRLKGELISHVRWFCTNVNGRGKECPGIGDIDKTGTESFISAHSAFIVQLPHDEPHPAWSLESRTRDIRMICWRLLFTSYWFRSILQNRHTYAQSQSYWFVTLWCDCPRIESFSTNLKQCHWNSDKRTFRFNTISITKFWEPDDWLPFVFTEEEFRGGTIGRINELEDSHRMHELTVSVRFKDMISESRW